MSSLESLSTQERSAFIAAAFKQACLDELSALKPGNVHIYADGHGMVVQDFIKSAEVASAVIAQPYLSVGQRIQAAVEATWQAVGCNTNLGIILLAAPIIQAAFSDIPDDLRSRLQSVLNELTVDDAKLAYQAIQRASPAGLGRSEHHDVSQEPAVSLLAGMQEAQQRDLIARQYANGYAEIFEFGIGRYRDTLARWERPGWATTSVYLGYLAKFNDSHIARKYGDEMASSVRREAEAHDLDLLALDNPKLYLKELMHLDADLKMRGLNPGTSADLTVATLLLVSLINGDVAV
ncbi:MAG: triphosphoribosyl-dephospho-CoA synthase [Methylophilaceae bacterium]